jgi:hypothetical protein
MHPIGQIALRELREGAGKRGLGRNLCASFPTGKAGVELLRPAPNDLLRMQLVSKRVNVSGRGDDDPGLIEPFEDEAIATSKCRSVELLSATLGALPESDWAP